MYKFVLFIVSFQYLYWFTHFNNILNIQNQNELFQKIFYFNYNLFISKEELYDKKRKC